MSFYGQPNDGCVLIERNVINLLERGTLTVAEYKVYLLLLLTIRPDTNEGVSQNMYLVRTLQMEQQQVQRALRGLRSKGYIQYQTRPGQRHCFPVKILVSYAMEVPDAAR
jgi:DNA-binding MarR family transcriptional regulator